MKIENIKIDEHSMLEVNNIYDKIRKNFVNTKTEIAPSLYKIGKGRNHFNLFTISHVDHYCSNSEFSKIQTNVQSL